MSSLLLLDGKNLRRYFEVYIPKLKLNSLVASVLFNLERAEFLADVYQTATDDLHSLKQKVDAEWKKRPLPRKFWDTFDTFIGLGFNRPKIVSKEIEFRRSKTREPDEYKQPFISLTDRYKNDEFREVREYIMERLSEYQLKLIR